MWEATEDIQIKKEYVAVILAALLGAIGFLGTGHLYAGRFLREIILLVVGWFVIGAGFTLFAFWSMSGMIIPPSGHPSVERPAITLVFLIAAIILFLGYVACGYSKS